MSVDTLAAPLYARIKDHIVDMVAKGELKPNDRIPSENALVKQFDVSRMTVHRALRELKEEGILVRVSGVGTFIADPKPKGHLITVNNIAEEVKSRGHKHSAKVMQNQAEHVSLEVALKMGVPSGTRVFHSVIVHLENDVPIQLEDRFVLAAALPHYGEVDFSKTTPNEYLMAQAPLQRVEHRVQAIRPDRKICGLLEISLDEPCLLLIRRTWSHRRVVSYALLTHPGSRFEFSDTFEPR
ncbi:MAG: histidine utilization repressor [Pseudomonadota bacterium]